MDKITFKNFRKLITSQPFFVWNDLPKNNDDEYELENFWFQDLDFANTSEKQVILKTFSKIKNKAEEILIKKGAVILSGSVEEKIKKTKELIKEEKIIINPIFEYREALAKPFAYDSKEKIIYEVKYSRNTKIIDVAKAYYQYEILLKNNIKIKDYYYFLPYNGPGKKGEINLVLVNTVAKNKTGTPYDERFQKSGLLKSKPVMEFLKRKIPISFLDIDMYINKINEAREIKKPIDSFNYDLTNFGANENWNELLEYFDHPYSGYNGKVVGKKQIVNNENIQSDVLNLLGKIYSPIIYNSAEVYEITTLIESSNRIVWYDFEGFSLPFPAVDDTKPYQQIPFQLSKIITDGNIKELENENLVWDPKTLGIDQLFEILKEVYSNKADKYVVYNKGYENTRLKEIVLLLTGDNRYEVANSMYQWIIDNTIDLMELFIINSPNKIPAILMHDQKARYSIKNIEKHISKNKYDIGYKIKEYKNLDVKNGGMAMQIAIERAIGVMGDNEWKQSVSNLKIYCENDVKAMIMVYYYIKFLIKEENKRNKRT